MMAHFEGLEHPRIEYATRHELLAIVAIALCVVIRGADTWVKVEERGQTKQARVAPFLALAGSLFIVHVAAYFDLGGPGLSPAADAPLTDLRLPAAF